MASFALPDDPDSNGSATTPIELTDLEREFIGFLLYQWGDNYTDGEKQSDWRVALQEKIKA